MASFVTYESLEIVFLHKPQGLKLEPGSFHSLSVSFREGDFDDLKRLIQTPPTTTVLYVVTPDQLNQYAEYVAGVQFVQRHFNTVGFFLFEPSRSKTTEQESYTEPLHLVGSMKGPYNRQKFVSELTKAAQHLVIRSHREIVGNILKKRDIEVKAINAVSLALAGQHTTDELMRVILDKSVELSGADAGFLLLRENLFQEPTANENAVKVLRRTGVKYVQKSRICKSQQLKLHPDMLDPNKSEFTSVISNRANGLSWARGMSAPLFWREEVSYRDGKVPKPKFEFDAENYFVKSYCVFPLRTPNHEVVGLIILVNRRRAPYESLKTKMDIERHVTEFSAHDLSILEAFSSQAGVSLDHSRLYNDLKTVFESFVQASVTAIESRDPSTRGHSERVAMMTVSFAEAVNQVHTGPYANIYFTPGQLYEIKYASLLHDFGKIGVREDVLRKENKLFSHELSLIRDRFEIIENKLRIKCLEAYLHGLMSRGEAPSPEGIARVRAEVDRVSSQLSELWQAVLDANEPHIVQTENVQKLIDFAAAKVLIGDESMNLISTDELTRLSIRRGSLSEEERIEIESHVTHSYRFLLQIPWTSELANIPDIVYAHHERLNGSGYPRKLISDEIPVQARLMAITDIYDALVAMDRPYKKAVSHERALDILGTEVREGKLDKDLFKVFVDANIGLLIRDTNSRIAS